MPRRRNLARRPAYLRPTCGPAVAHPRPTCSPENWFAHGPLHRWCGACGGCRGSEASRGMGRSCGRAAGGGAISLARSRFILMASKLQAPMDTQKHANGTQPGSGAVEQSQNINGSRHKPSARTRSARPVGEGRPAGYANSPEQLQRPAGQGATASQTENAVVTQFVFRGCPLRPPSSC